jgi:hypothetical protein
MVLVSNNAETIRNSVKRTSRKSRFTVTDARIMLSDGAIGAEVLLPVFTIACNSHRR